MTTFATNFISCSAEYVKDLAWGWGGGGGGKFWRRIEAYDFWLSTTCCLNACCLYAGHPL